MIYGEKTAPWRQGVVCDHLSGDGYLYYGSAPFAGVYGKFSALQLQPLLYVRQRDMRLLIVGRRKAGAVVFYDDLAAGICLPGPYGDVQGGVLGIHAVLDGILHNGLESQRRQAEFLVQDIIVYRKAVFKLHLFHGQIGAGVLQLVSKGHGVLAGNGGEVLAKIGGEIQRDLLSLLGILGAEIVDAHHGIVDEVGSHLQHHDAGALMGDFPLLAHILLDLVEKDDAEHGKGREDEAGEDQLREIPKCMYYMCSRQ